MNSRKLARALETERTYRDGQAIFREGEPGSEMFFIRAGGVRITKHGADLAQLSKGDFFGEMSVLESMPRDADATAVGDTTLQIVGSGGLLMRLRRDPTLALEMLHKFSGRVRALNAQIGVHEQR